MALELNRIETEALDRKFEHPEEEVKCPRCGKPLVFIEGDSSDEVRCETKGCIFDIIRGI